MLSAGDRMRRERARGGQPAPGQGPGRRRVVARALRPPARRQSARSSSPPRGAKSVP